MRIILFIIAISLGHSLTAQDEDEDSNLSKEGPVYIQGFADFGFAAAVNEGSANALRVNLIIGVAINDWLFIGAGPGIRISRSLRSIPLLADMRIGNMTRKRAFYGAIGGGMSMGSKTNFEYIGPAAHAELGARFNNDRKGGFLVFLGYEAFSAEMTDDVPIRSNGIVIHRASLHRLLDITAITVGVGFCF